MSFHNRRFVLVKDAGKDTVNFSQVLQNSYTSTRKRNDGAEFLIKWDGAEPSTIGDLRTAGHLATYNGNDVHTHEEILAILATTGSTGWTTNELP